MANISKQRSAISKWLMDSGDPTSSSLISNRLEKALQSPKLADIETFASSTFTHAELSEIGIPEDILGKAQARAQEFVSNKQVAINTVSSQMDALTNEQFESAMSMIDRVTNFDQKVDTSSWASSMINSTTQMTTVGGINQEPTNVHNLQFGKPSEARVTVSTGNGITVRNAHSLALSAASDNGFRFFAETEDDFGPVSRFYKGDENDRTFYDLSYETTTGAVMWGEAGATRRAVMGRSVEAKIGGDFNKAMTGMSMLEPGDALRNIVSGSGSVSRVSGGRSRSSGGLGTIDIQSATHHQLMDQLHEVSVPKSVWMGGNIPDYVTSPQDLATMSDFSSRYVTDKRGRETVYAPIGNNKGMLREATQTVRQSLGYYIDENGIEQMRGVKTAKDSKREYMRGGSAGFGPATGLLTSPQTESLIRQIGMPADRQQISNVVITDDRAAFGEGEAKVLPGSMIQKRRQTTMYGYSMENVPFQKGDLFTKSGNVPSNIAEGARFAGSYKDVTANNFQFGNEPEHLISDIRWDENIGAPVVSSIAGSHMGIGEFKVTSGMKGQMKQVNETDPHFQGLSAIGIRPDIIAPQPSKDERLRNVAMRAFQAEQDPDTIRRYLRSAAVNRMDQDQFAAAFGTNGSIDITGAHGDIVMDAASTYLLAEKGFEYNVKGQRINANDWESFVESRKHVYGEDSGISSSQAVRDPNGQVLYYTADYKARGLHTDIMGDVLPNSTTGRNKINADLFSAMAMNQPEAFDMVMKDFNLRRSSTANLARGAVANIMGSKTLTPAARDVRKSMEFVDIKDLGLDEAINRVAAIYPDMTGVERERMVLQELGKTHGHKNIMANGMAMMSAKDLAKNYELQGRESKMSVGPSGYNALMANYYGNEDEINSANEAYLSSIRNKLENSNMKDLSRVSVAGFGGPARALELPWNMHVVREQDARDVLRQNVGEDAMRAAMDDLRSGNMRGIANMPHGQRNMTWAGARVVTQEWLRGDALNNSGFWGRYDESTKDVTDPRSRSYLAQLELGSEIELVNRRIRSAQGASEGLYNEDAYKKLIRQKEQLEQYHEGFSEFGADFFRKFSNVELTPGTVASSIDYYRMINKDFDGDLAPNVMMIPGLKEHQIRDSFTEDPRRRSFMSTGMEAKSSISKFGRDMFDILRQRELSLVEKGGEMVQRFGALTPQKIRGSAVDKTGDIGGAFADKDMAMSYQPFHRNMYAVAMMRGGMDDPDMRNAAGMAGDVVYQAAMDKNFIRSMSARSFMFGRDRIRMGMNDDGSKFGLNLVGSIVGNKEGNRVDFEEQIFDMMATSGMQIGTEDDQEIFSQEGGVGNAMATMLNAGGSVEDIRNILIEMQKKGADAGLTYGKDKWVTGLSNVSRQDRMGLLGAATGQEITGKNYRSALRKYILGVDDNDNFNIENTSIMGSWVMSEVARNTLDIKETSPSQVTQRAELLMKLTKGQQKSLDYFAGIGRDLESQRAINQGKNGIGGILKHARSIANHPVMRGGAKLAQMVMGTEGYEDWPITDEEMKTSAKGRFAMVGETGPEILDQATGDVIPARVTKQLMGGLPHQALNIPKFAEGTDNWEESYADFMQGDNGYYEGLSANMSSKAPPKPTKQQVSGGTNAMNPGTIKRTRAQKEALHNERIRVEAEKKASMSDEEQQAEQARLDEEYARDGSYERDNPVGLSSNYRQNLDQSDFKGKAVVGNLNINNLEPLNTSDLSALRSARKRMRTIESVLRHKPGRIAESSTFSKYVADTYASVDEVMAKKALLEASGMSTAIAGGGRGSSQQFDKLAEEISNDPRYSGNESTRLASYQHLANTRDLNAFSDALGPKGARLDRSVQNIADMRPQLPQLIKGIEGAGRGGSSEELWTADKLLKDWEAATGQGRKTAMSPIAAGRLADVVKQAEDRGVKASAPTMDSQVGYSANTSVDAIPRLMGDFSEQISKLKGALPDTNKEMSNFVGTFNKVSQMYKDWNEEFQNTAAQAAAGDSDAQRRLAQMKPDKARMDQVAKTIEGAQGNAYEAAQRVAMSRYGSMGLEERESLLAQYSQQGGFTGRRRRASSEYAELRESVLNEKYGEDGIARRIAGATFEPIAGATRMMNRATGTMFATMMARNQIAVPMGQLADTYQTQEIARQQNLLTSGSGGSYADFMSGEYGRIKRRSARNELGMGAIGKEIYDTWGGVMNAGLGETFTPMIGNAASLIGPAVGAGMIAKQAFGSGTAGLIAGAGMYLAGSGISAINNMRNSSATTDILYNSQVADDTAGSAGRFLNSLGSAVSDPLGTLSIIGGAITQSDTFMEGKQNAETRYDARKFIRGQFGGWGTENLNQWINNQGDPNAAKFAQKELESYLADDMGVGQEQSLRYFRTQQMYGDNLSSSSYDPIKWMRDVEKYRSYGATNVLDSAQNIMQGRGFISDSGEYGKAVAGLSQRYESAIAGGKNIAIEDQLLQSSIGFANQVNQYQVASGQQQISAFQAYDSGIAGNLYEMQRQSNVYSGVANLRTSSVEFGANFGDQMSQYGLGLHNQFDTTRYMNRMQQIGGFANQFGYTAGSANAYANEAILSNMAENGSERQFRRTLGIASGDKWEISRAAQGASGSSMDAQRYAVYNQIDTQSGLGVYETDISARELEGIQAWSLNGGRAMRNAISNVDVSGGTTGVRANVSDMQYGISQYQYGFQRDMSMAQFAMVTGGASPLAGGGSGTFGGALKGMVSPEVAGSLANSFEKMAKAAEPTAAGLEKMGEIFDKYGFSLDTGSGMGQWQLEDAQRNLSRQQQMYGIQQQEQGLGLQQQGRDLRWRQFFEQLGLDKEKMQFGFEKQGTEMRIGREHQKTQEGWQMADWSYGRSQMEMQFGWQQEDMDLNLRYARGMQRRQLLRQQERQTISHSMQAAKSDVDKGRLEETSEWSKESYDRKRQYFQQEMEFSKRAMAMRERHFRESFALEDERFKMTQERHEQEKAWMQERWQLEDQSINLQRQWYVFQFEQSEKMAEQTQNTSMNMKDMQLAMEAISLASRQSAGALEVSNKELRTLTELMPDLTTEILELPKAHAEAGNKIVSQSSKQFNDLTESFSNSMIGMIKNLTGSVGGRTSSSSSTRVGAGGGGHDYDDGGYTGSGPNNRSVGTVGPGEYVIPAEGAPVIRGTDPEMLSETKAIRKALEKLISMGLYNVNATVYTSDRDVKAKDLNPIDELFRTS